MTMHSASSSYTEQAMLDRVADIPGYGVPQSAMFSGYLHANKVYKYAICEQGNRKQFALFAVADTPSHLFAAGWRKRERGPRLPPLLVRRERRQSRQRPGCSLA
jgi:hypothetical protein